MLYDRKSLEEIIQSQETWTREELQKVLDRSGERLDRFSTISDMEIPRLSTPVDTKDFDYLEKLGLPGDFPYTRGVYPTMYRGRLWTMRQFAGFGTPEDTNQRFHYLLGQGQTGLSVAFHYPTLMGYDSDHPRSLGEVGKCGVAIDSLRDMEVMFDGIPLDKVTTSMTINGPAGILLAMYIAVAEKQGIPADKIGGTIQNDILKEYIAQKSWIFPPRPSMRIITDILEYCTKRVPRWNTISISGYHIREAGSTAVQELAFTLADGIGYVQAGIDVGLKVDDFAPRLSFFFNSHSDFFEEIAKYRAARRIWAKVMKERFKANKEASCKLRFHSQTAGCSLTAQQPINNVVRTTLQALSAVLGGTQSLHTNSMDETLALPTENAVTVALRTQQIIAEETGVVNNIDPLAGSYFIEWLTDHMEAEAMQYIDKIDELGGIIRAIELGFPQKEIGDAAYTYQGQLEKEEKIIVGLNKYQMEEEIPFSTLKIDEQVTQLQIDNLNAVRNKRDNSKVKTQLKKIEQAAQDGSNLMECFVEAVKEYCTLGEIIDVLRGVFGEYHDPGML
ncbi:MAG: methylmalonyl-CoA mutase family protein [Deltaproteobacteria bacterium]|nr:methylmalonyl-CoA mutase family protein [Deltaproteobacteria bacterium]